MPWEGDTPQDREITPEERACLAMMLAGLPTEFDVYMSQLEQLRVTGTCECECGTIDLEPRRDAPSGLHKRAIIGDGLAEYAIEEGQKSPGSVIVFIDDGKLSLLEFVRYGDWDMNHPTRLYTKQPREVPHGTMEAN